jgi:glycogen debranching enzyme
MRAPHAATGCPFQAWSVAEVLRVRRALQQPAGDLATALSPAARA